MLETDTPSTRFAVDMPRSLREKLSACMETLGALWRSFGNGLSFTPLRVVKTPFCTRNKVTSLPLGRQVACQVVDVQGVSVFEGVSGLDQYVLGHRFAPLVPGKDRSLRGLYLTVFYKAAVSQSTMTPSVCSQTKRDLTHPSSKGVQKNEVSFRVLNIQRPSTRTYSSSYRAEPQTGRCPSA